MIKKLKQKIVCTLSLRKILKTNENYILNGRYFLDISGKPMGFLKNKNTKLFLKAYKSEYIGTLKTKISTIFYKILDFIFNVKIKSNENKVYNSELLMIDINGNIKLFDFKNNNVYTIIKDFKEYNKLSQVNQQMQNIYNLTFIEFDNDHQIIIEKYINFKSRDSWSENDFNLAIKEIIKGIKKNLVATQSKNIQNMQILVNEFKTKKLNEELVKSVLDLVPKDVENDIFEVIRINGDMNFNNILLNDGIFYFIDWDESTNAVFFYDFIHAIFADWAGTRNTYFIKAYFDGKYDNLLNNMFLHSNILFEENKKKLYFAIYVMNRFLMFDNLSDSIVLSENETLYIDALNDLKIFKWYE